MKLSAVLFTKKGEPFIVDRSMVPRLKDLCFWLTHNRHVHYSTKGKRQIGILAHLVLSPVAGKVVDHKDRNPLNNRRSNLRVASYSLNNYNSKARPNSTGYRGVSKSGNRFQAKIKNNKRWHHLGYFATPLEASVAYQAARKRLVPSE